MEFNIFFNKGLLQFLNFFCLFTGEAYTCSRNLRRASLLIVNNPFVDVAFEAHRLQLQLLISCHDCFIFKISINAKTISIVDWLPILEII